MAPTGRDLARVRLVTQRYGELRGLQPAAFALSGILGVWSVRMLFGPAASIWGVVPGLAVGAVAESFFAAEYDATFGRVKQCARESRWRCMFPFAIATAVVADSATRGDGYPSALFLLIAATQALVAVRDWPVRGYYFGGAAASALAALLHSRVTAAPATHDEWLVAALTICGLGAVLVGMLDHRVLVSTLRPQGKKSDEGERVESI